MHHTPWLPRTQDYPPTPYPPKEGTISYIKGSFAILNKFLGQHHVPGGGPLQLGGVDGGDGGAAARLVADPVQRVLGCVPTVAS